MLISILFVGWLVVNSTSRMLSHNKLIKVALTETNGTDLLTDCFLQVKLESNFASVVFAIMVLEGLGRSLDPGLDILELAKPLLLKNYASLL